MDSAAIVDQGRKLIGLFQRRERWQLLGLAIAMIANALVEIVGMTALLHFMRLVVNPAAIEQTEALAYVYRTLSFSSTDSFLLFSGAILLAQIALANAFSSFTLWLMFRFVWTKSHHLSTRLLHSYVSQPYSFFIARNTSGLTRTLLEEVWNVIGGVLMPILTFVARLITTCLLLGFLAVVNFKLTVSMAAALGTAYVAIYLLVRRRQARLGQHRFSANAERFRVADEALRGIKTVKVMGREPAFMRRFIAASGYYSRAMCSNQVVSKLPRYALETLVFGGVVATILAYLSLGNSIGDIIPVLSVYSFAAYRLLPALHELFASFVQIRFHAPALEAIHLDLSGQPEAAAVELGAHELSERESKKHALTFSSAVELHDVNFSYDSAKGPALAEVSLRIPKNRSVGIVGRTGSGKSTLVDILLGLLSPQSGELRVDGRPLPGEHIRRWRSNCGYVPQNIFLCDDSLRANIAFGVPRDEIDDAAVIRSAKVAQIHDFARQLPQGYETEVGERGVRLSGGERQRIAIARALYHDPDLLVLDEATSALDGLTERAVIDTIQELAHKKTLVVIAHRLSTVRECDVIYVMESGRISATGTYDELVATDPTFRAMIGLDDPDDDA